jgi:dephospho-CoA kinase
MTGEGKGRPFLLAVTGGIASGKSTVSRILEEMGAPLVDLDVLARKVVEPGKPAFLEIMHFFGPTVLDPSGRLDRKRLSDLVFRDPLKRKKLEGFTHPRIFEEMDRRIQEIAVARPGGIIQVAVPLLFENGLEVRFHKVLLVYAPREVQVQRLMARDGISREAAESILDAQLPMDEKIGKADFVIYNQGTFDEMRRQVEKVWGEIQRTAGSKQKTGKAKTASSEQ